MARIAFAGVVSKELQSPDLTEDFFDHSLTGDLVVVCDGASESYDSRTWARILVHSYLDQPRFDACWLNDAIDAYNRQMDYGGLTWSQQAAVARGNYSTFLSAKLVEDSGAVELFAVGDSIAVLVNGTSFEQAFPLTRSVDFAANPLLLSTRPEANRFVSDPSFSALHSSRFDTTSTSTVLLMTDAIGAWCLASVETGDDRWRTLLEVSTPREYEALVVGERTARKMKIDDTTLVRLSFDE